MHREELKQYSKVQRLVELFAIIAYLSTVVALFVIIGFHVTSHIFIVIVAFLLGMFAADMMTGLLHWAGDTWGRHSWPIIGPVFIRPFREHHVDQKAITHHDFIETNGSNSLFSLPFVIIALMFAFSSSLTAGRIFLITFLGSTALCGFLTNQFHKWAHMDYPPRVAVLLQNLGLILSPTHHKIHHTAPFEHHYAITNGWTNGFTRAIGFYRALEWGISKITGAVPRESDTHVVSIIKRD